MKDEMKPIDWPPKVEIKCAKCGQLVEIGQPHVCKAEEKEKKDEK